MLTLHTADVLVPGAGAAPVPGGAAAVDGSTLTAVGTYEDLAVTFPHARVRRWPGLLTPGLVHRGAGPLLERAYHPDPREAGTLGTEPLTGAALDMLGPDDARWGGSARRGLQRLLRHGVTAVAGPFGRPAVRTAVARVGVVVTAPPGADADGPFPELDPLAACPPERAFAGALVPGARADLAVFDVPDLPALAGTGAVSCVATVLAGRLAHRRR